MAKETNTRVDKWLWFVRIYKTRTIATDACKGGLVKYKDQNIKPSKDIKIGDVLLIKRSGLNVKVEVLDFPSTRLPARDVPMYLKDLTTKEEIEQYRLSLLVHSGIRDRGTGRPTKKDRRDINSITWLDDEEFDWSTDL